MNTSAKTPILSEILEGKPIPAGKLAYFRERFRDHLYDLVLSEFKAREKEGLKKSDIAKRIRRSPEQITRWLGAPGNWTLETVSDLLLAVSKAEPNVVLSPLTGRLRKNMPERSWTDPPPSDSKSSQDKSGAENIVNIFEAKRDHRNDDNASQLGRNANQRAAFQ